MKIYGLANQKPGKAIDNVRHFILNKIHFVYSKFMASFSLIYSRHLTSDVRFLRVCPLIDDKFRHNIVNVYWGTTLTML